MMGQLQAPVFQPQKLAARVSLFAAEKNLHRVAEIYFDRPLSKKGGHSESQRFREINHGSFTRVVVCEIPCWRGHFNHFQPSSVQSALHCVAIKISNMRDAEMPPTRSKPARHERFHIWRGQYPDAVGF